MDVPPPSGAQVELSAGPWSAAVVEVGGGIRALEHDGRPVLDGYGAREMASGGRGQPLMPWPNRLAEGRYRWGDRELQLDLSEPGRGDAIHGLVRWRAWRVEERAADRCAMALRLHPTPGYPFTLDLRIEHALGPDGLTVTTTARNVGAEPAPWGCGFHPYLTVGTALVDEARIRVPAATTLETDHLGLPTGRRLPVAGTPFDLREPAEIGDRVLDTCYTDLERDADGLARVTLEAPDGRRAALWVDGAHPYVMVFTGDTLPAERRRRGVAVEPMTCPPNAFRTGEDLRVLAPGEAAVVRWGISA
jgi:aldose 1-epimerase